MYPSNLTRWTLFTLAAFTFAATAALGAGGAGKRCKTTPCTYFNHGQALSGKCGAMKVKKSVLCECIVVISKKKVGQAQSGCSLGS